MFSERAAVAFITLSLVLGGGLGWAVVADYNAAKNQKVVATGNGGWQWRNRGRDRRPQRGSGRRGRGRFGRRRRRRRFELQRRRGQEHGCPGDQPGRIGCVA